MWLKMLCITTTHVMLNLFQHLFTREIDPETSSGRQFSWFFKGFLIILCKNTGKFAQVQKEETLLNSFVTIYISITARNNKSVIRYCWSGKYCTQIIIHRQHFIIRFQYLSDIITK